MEKDRKPIKRSAALTPLSHDHHEALLLVWKIRHGIKNDIELNRISSYCLWFWRHHLEHHFEQEEKVLVPFFGIGSLYSSRLFTEHKAIRDLIKALSAEPDLALLEKLANTLNDHVRFEERTLFNEVEALATPEQLGEIGEALKEEKMAELWEDEFWIIKR